MSWLTFHRQKKIALAHAHYWVTAVGATISQAVDFFLSHYRKVPVPALKTLVDELLEVKRLSEKRHRYLQQLRHSLNAFLVGRQEERVDQVTTAEISHWLFGNGWKLATMRSYLIDVRTLFSFAIKRDYCLKNPAASVEMPMLEDKPPGIFTVPECPSLLESALEVDRGLCPFIAVQLFGGLRPVEAQSSPQSR